MAKKQFITTEEKNSGRELLFSRQKNGKAKWYNSTGKLIAQYNYNIGLFDGLQLTFYSNDTIRSKQMFKNDVKVGIY